MTNCQLFKTGHPYLFNAQVGVAGRDSLPEIMAQRVEHGVVWVHRGQAVLLKLLGHDADQFLHAGLIVSPVAHNLQAVSQVAVRIREVRLQFQGSAVRLDSFWDVSRVLSTENIK